MADSAGTDTHRMCTRTYVPHVLRRTLDPLSPTPLLLAAPPRTLSMPTTPPPPFLRMHVLAETANEASSFL